MGDCGAQDTWLYFITYNMGLLMIMQQRLNGVMATLCELAGPEDTTEKLEEE